ncbi:hypothetical protein [Brevundimonas sp. EYE_349]|uniref:hypothetical protein n=1 Tax=Brevundimonas sp. EYE_349 TaxID=2853455 RepID=UPI0020051602|nr:hypothetical protein [Brevundimonas sp. EYE_349]MCK6102904.1 hypothetical protein [Brevundimonas sp. EYE_349]
MSFSLSQTADAIATVSHRPDAQRVLVQLRGLHQRGHLRSAARNGQGHHLINVEEAVLAAILTEALDQGVTSADVAMLESTLRNGRNVVDLIAGTYPISLGANLPRIADGERWLIEVTRRPDPETGELRAIPIWARTSNDGRVWRFGRDLYPDPMRLDAEGAVASVLTINVAHIATRVQAALGAVQ